LQWRQNQSFRERHVRHDIGDRMSRAGKPAFRVGCAELM
jgi:hypothetical protein